MIFERKEPSGVLGRQQEYFPTDYKHDSKRHYLLPDVCLMVCQDKQNEMDIEDWHAAGYTNVSGYRKRVQ